MLTDREAFKVGFLARCAENGLMPEQMLRSVKQAQANLEKCAFPGEIVAGKLIDAGKTLGGIGLGWGIPALLAAPPIAGGIAGYGLAKGTDIDDTDVNEVKNKEIVDEYKLQADKLRRQNAVRTYLQAKRRTGRIYPG